MSKPRFDKMAYPAPALQRVDHCDCSISAPPENQIQISSYIETSNESQICCECKGTIPAGKKFEFSETRGAVFSKFATCIGCARLRKKYCPRGAMIGQLAKQLESCLGFNYVTDKGADEFEHMYSWTLTL